MQLEQEACAMERHKYLTEFPGRYSRLEYRLRRYTRRREDAQDAIQQATVALLAPHSAGEAAAVRRLPPNEEEAFVTVAARRYLSGLRRHERQLPELPLEAELCGASDSLLQQTIDRVLIQAALKRLGQQEQDLLRLHREGDTCEDITQHLDISSEAAKKRLQRTRAKFRNALIAVGYGDPLAP